MRRVARPARGRAAPSRMLPLDSPRWRELAQAYGPAHDVPRLLAHLDQVSGAERAELWLGLWATLCRRGRVYTASYAALPHLVAFAERHPPADRARALHLVAAIDVGRQGAAAPAVPAELAAAYARAMDRVPGGIAAAAGEPWDADTVQILCGALAVAKWHPRFGSAALRLEAVVSCPICGSAHSPLGWELGVDD